MITLDHDEVSYLMNMKLNDLKNFVYSFPFNVFLSITNNHPMRLRLR